MKARLVIKNFGPIDNLDIEISRFNILIGPHASGKSTISKVLCVIHSFFAEILFEKSVATNVEVSPAVIATTNLSDGRIKKLLTNYRIEKFLQKKTYLFFEDEVFTFEFKSRKISLSSIGNFIGNSIDESYYLPAERIALPMISESLFELTFEQSTLPGYFLKFGKDFTIARKNQALFNIPLLKVKFEYKDGKNAVILENNNSLLLEETSSAIQANLPLLIILQYPTKKASVFVIEELELHGFPLLQKELLNYVVERTTHPYLNNAYVMLPTHSPYILSAANNLLFAAKVAKQDDESALEVDKIISKNSWINKDDFSAYYLENGKAVSIVNEKTGMIDENELDSISESLAGEFDSLMELYRPAIV